MAMGWGVGVGWSSLRLLGARPVEPTDIRAGREKGVACTVILQDPALPARVGFPGKREGCPHPGLGTGCSLEGCAVRGHAGCRGGSGGVGKADPWGPMPLPCPREARG